MRLGHHPPATISDIYLQCFPAKKRSQSPQMSAPACPRCSLPARREHRLLKASRLSFLLITKDLSSSGRSRWHRGAVPGKASLPGELGGDDAKGAYKHKAEKCICMRLLPAAFLSGIFSCLSALQKDWPQLHGEHHSFHGLDGGEVAWEGGEDRELSPGEASGRSLPERLAVTRVGIWNCLGKTGCEMSTVLCESGLR